MIIYFILNNLALIFLLSISAFVLYRAVTELYMSYIDHSKRFITKEHLSQHVIQIYGIVMTYACGLLVSVYIGMNYIGIQQLLTIFNDLIVVSTGVLLNTIVLMLVKHLRFERTGKLANTLKGPLYG